MYQKEIIYLGLYKDGDRLGNAGFLKVEKRDRDKNLTLVVKNVPHSINGRYPVRYYNGSDWKEADTITVQEGGGQWEKKETDPIEQVRLQITLPGGYLVEGVSKETVSEPVTPVTPTDGRREEDIDREVLSESAMPAVISETQREEDSDREMASESVMPAMEAESLREEDADRETISEPMMRAMPVEIRQEPPQKIERIVVQKQRSKGNGTASEQNRKPLMADAFVIEGLKEDKWEQILDTYDNIHPYDDERIYVKLEPKDFIILSGKYQHLVNNSFLLHGFYNYRHVILGKEGETHYLGVPGVFYEREKMVALMFGFEAFECGCGEPKAGDFGYYLRKVEL